MVTAWSEARNASEDVISPGNSWIVPGSYRTSTCCITWGLYVPQEACVLKVLSCITINTGEALAGLSGALSCYNWGNLC